MFDVQSFRSAQYFRVKESLALPNVTNQTHSKVRRDSIDWLLGNRQRSISVSNSRPNNTSIQNGKRAPKAAGNLRLCKYMTGNKLISEITLLKMKQFSVVCGPRIAGRGIITGSGITRCSGSWLLEQMGRLSQVFE
jgi:hypothetical protein